MIPAYSLPYLLPICIMPIGTWISEKTLQSLSSSSVTNRDSISYWLSHTPSPPLSTACSGKRKRSHSINDMSTRNSSPSKRRRGEQADYGSSAAEEVESTSRVNSSTPSEPPSTQSGRSKSQRKKQTLRKMAQLSLLPNPVMMKSIDDAAATPPIELEDMALKLGRIGRGLGVISRSEKVGACLHPTC